MDAKNKNILNKIRNKYTLKKIVEYLAEYKALETIKYNKYIQDRIGKGINDYKDFKKIIIEIFPINNNDKNIFINFEKEDKPYYHVYFNNENKERKINYFTKNQNITNIKIIIDEEIKSFKYLFCVCNCIEKVNFIKFNRKDIYDMSYMFFKCSSLKEINFNNFHTDNVIDMSYMFSECSSLKELKLDNFNTIKVTRMCGMFQGCSSLKELNLNNFNTINVTDMSHMFYGCSSFIKLYISYFNFTNVTNMNGIFF